MSEQPGDEQPTIREIEEEVAEENPDPTTRREAFELELMEEDRSEEGRDVSLEEDLGS